MYRETEASITARETAAANRKLVGAGPDHRPDKKERRALSKFRRTL
jgi:ribosome-associated heat shock protein Hsp15